MMTAEQATELLRDKHGPACWCITCRAAERHLLCEVCSREASYFWGRAFLCSLCHDDFEDYSRSFGEQPNMGRLERWLRMVLP